MVDRRLSAALALGLVAFVAWPSSSSAVTESVDATAPSSPSMTSTTTESLTLDAYLERVLGEGLAARAQDLTLAAAHVEIDATGIWPNPSVEISRQANAFGVRAGESQDQLLMSIPLVISGRRALLQDVATKDAEATAARLAHARGQLRHEATEAYLAVIAARQHVAAKREALASIESVVETIRAREAAGEAAGYERVRLELERERIAIALLASVEDEAVATDAALALLAPSTSLSTSMTTFADAPLSSALDGSVSDIKPTNDTILSRGDVVALVHEADAARLAEDAAGRMLIPEPTLFGGGNALDLGRSQLGVAYVIGLEVPVPIFERGQGERARARARRTLVDAERAALVQAAQSRLDIAMHERQARRARAERHDADVVTRANELREITTVAYRAGAAELLALVDAERVHHDSRVASIELHLAARRAENDTLLLTGAYDRAPRSQAP